MTVPGETITTSAWMTVLSSGKRPSRGRRAPSRSRRSPAAWGRSRPWRDSRYPLRHGDCLWREDGCLPGGSIVFLETVGVSAETVGVFQDLKAVLGDVKDGWARGSSSGRRLTAHPQCRDAVGRLLNDDACPETYWRVTSVHPKHPPARDVPRDVSTLVGYRRSDLSRGQNDLHHSAP